MAWLCYAGKTKLVAVKQSAWEGSAAHPELNGAKSGTGEATEMRFDVHSNHGGASNYGGDVPVAVMDKMIKQQGIKHHGIKAKLEVH